MAKGRPKPEGSNSHSTQDYAVASATGAYRCTECAARFDIKRECLTELDARRQLEKSLSADHRNRRDHPQYLRLIP